MASLNSLSYHVSSLPAKAVQTPTHAFGGVVGGFGKRKMASIHSESCLGNPPSLSAGRSNPHSGFSTSVNNPECPLCLEFQNIIVRNHLSFQGVNDLEHLIPKNEFGSNPDCKGKRNQHETDQHFDQDLSWVSVDNKTVGCEKTNEQNRNARPNKIASWAKGFIHKPIIAGETQ